jgi:hypothetical protein
MLNVLHFCGGVDFRHVFCFKCATKLIRQAACFVVKPKSGLKFKNSYKTFLAICVNSSSDGGHEEIKCHNNSLHQVYAKLAPRAVSMQRSANIPKTLVKS